MTGPARFARWLFHPRWAQAVPRSAWRSRRLPRWLAILIDRPPPRGAGVAAVALLLAASLGYGAVRGEHSETVAAEVQDICDTLANAAGFGITEVAIAGQGDLSREDILSLAGITGHSSLLFLDAAKTRGRLLANPWIADAAVLKLYPGRLHIALKERQPFALWQKDGEVSLIARDGTVLEHDVPARFAKLPVVVGTGAAHRAGNFLALMAHYPAIAQQVRASVLVAQRRWNLYLKNGVEVLLPEAGSDRALQTLVDLDRDKKLLARDIVLVDLRLNDRVTVRLSDAAAAAREEAVKQAEKARKKRRKAGEA
jgi:cell division protein FtsQ